MAKLLPLAAIIRSLNECNNYHPKYGMLTNLVFKKGRGWSANANGKNVDLEDDWVKANVPVEWGRQTKLRESGVRTASVCWAYKTSELGFSNGSEAEQALSGGVSSKEKAVIRADLSKYGLTLLSVSFDNVDSDRTDAGCYFTVRASGNEEAFEAYCQANSGMPFEEAITESNKPLYNCKACGTGVVLSPPLSQRSGSNGPMTRKEALSLFRDAKGGLCVDCFIKKRKGESTAARILAVLSESNTFNNGDIVSLTGRLERHGYYRVDTERAVGASQERPWVEDIDSGGGWYIDPSDLGCLELVLSSDDCDTSEMTSAEVEEALNDDEDDSWLSEGMKINTLKKQAQNSTKRRGHSMKWGEVFGRANGPKSQNGQCRNCGAYCFLSENPAPNGRGVSGLAVAFDCKH